MASKNATPSGAAFAFNAPTYASNAIGGHAAVRFNGMEDNVVLWTFNKGVRKFVKRGTENVPLTKNQWHTLQISVHGTSLQASLNGKHLLDYALAEPVAGKIGVWSKTDSVSFFDDFTVTK